MSRHLPSLLDELRIHAQDGRTHAHDQRDEARYERILELVSEWYGEAYDLPPSDVRARFAAEVGHVMPKVSADAAVFDDGRVLLKRRRDDGTWCLPGGYADPNEAPAETAVRETRVETGLDVEPLDLVDVYVRNAGDAGPHCLGVHLYHCARRGGERSVSIEGDAVEFRRMDEVHEWHEDHEAHARAARRHARPNVT